MNSMNKSTHTHPCTIGNDVHVDHNNITIILGSCEDVDVEDLW